MTAEGIIDSLCGTGTNSFLDLMVDGLIKQLGDSQNTFAPTRYSQL